MPDSLAPRNPQPATVAVAESGAVATEQRSLLAGLPVWCRVLIGHIQAGATLDKARYMQGSKVSPTIIGRAQRDYPAFREALRLVLAGQQLGSTDDTREVARAMMLSNLGDAYAESRGLDPVTGDRDPRSRGADRVANRRYIGEVGGAIGSGAQGAGPSIQVSASQVAILVQGLSPQQLQALVSQHNETGMSKPNEA